MRAVRHAVRNQLQLQQLALPSVVILTTPSLVTIQLQITWPVNVRLGTVLGTAVRRATRPIATQLPAMEFSWLHSTQLRRWTMWKWMTIRILAAR